MSWAPDWIWGSQTRGSTEHPTVAIVGLPDSAKENTGCPVKFEFQINNFFYCKYITNITQTYLGQKKPLFVVHLKFKFNWASCILSTEPTIRGRYQAVSGLV